MGREWKVISRRSILSRPPWFEVHQEEIRLPDGRRINDFYSISIPEYVVVVGFDQKGYLLMERHYRHGVGEVTWSLPGGYLEPGEDALNAAKRELREETGYEAESWEPIGRYAVDGNRGCGWANIIIAEKVIRVAEPDGADLAEIEVGLKPPGEVLLAMLDGGVAELAAAAALGLVFAKRGGIKRAAATA